MPIFFLQIQVTAQIQASNSQDLNDLLALEPYIKCLWRVMMTILDEGDELHTKGGRQRCQLGDEKRKACMYQVHIEVDKNKLHSQI